MWGSGERKLSREAVWSVGVLLTQAEGGLGFSFSVKATPQIIILFFGMNNGYFLHLKLGAAKSIFRPVGSLNWHIIWNQSKNSMFEAYDWILMLSLLTLEWAAALFSWKGSRAADNGHPSKFQELTCLGLCWHGPCEQPASGQTWLNFFLLLPGAQSVLWEHIMKEIYLV